MENEIKGIHHITAIAGDARRNFEFYTKVLGLRLVKKTVNFDDPETYHLYYGDKFGSPGTILTFFPWEGITAGRSGSHQVTAIGYAVPEGSFEFWEKRFADFNIKYSRPMARFDEQVMSFSDPDGLNFELISSPVPDERTPWITDEVTSAYATKGFFNVTITTNKNDPTAKVLTDLLGYRMLAEENNRQRFITDTVRSAAAIDLLEIPGAAAGHTAGGSVHHIAFRVKDEATLMAYRDKIISAGIQITEKKDRNYFYSLYFREPGGVLFELATDNPGFDVDEAIDELGTHLKLPPQYERYREALEKSLPKLDQ